MCYTLLAECAIDSGDAWREACGRVRGDHGRGCLAGDGNAESVWEDGI